MAECSAVIDLVRGVGRPVIVVQLLELPFRRIVAGALLVAGLVATGTAAAQTPDQLRSCRNLDSLFSFDQQISGCTAVIDAGRRSKLDLHFAFHSRGYAYYKKDNFEGAIADFSEAIRLDPEDAHALNGRCWMRTIVGRDLREALEDCNAALRLRPDDAATIDSRGFACLKLGQLNNAIAEYDAALALAPGQAESRYGRGAAKLQKGDKEGGNADIAAAKVLDPGIAEEFAKYGVRQNGAVVSITPAPTSRADCGRAIASR